MLYALIIRARVGSTNTDLGSWILDLDHQIIRKEGPSLAAITAPGLRSCHLGHRLPAWPRYTLSFPSNTQRLQRSSLAIAPSTALIQSRSLTWAESSAFPERLSRKMPSKQVTLGYVKSGQQTLGCTPRTLLPPSSVADLGWGIKQIPR